MATTNSPQRRPPSSREGTFSGNIFRTFAKSGRFTKSDMSWGIEGGGVTLTLCLATMSQVWERVYRNYLTNRPLPTLDTKMPTSNQGYAKSA